MMHVPSPLPGHTRHGVDQLRHKSLPMAIQIHTMRTFTGTVCTCYLSWKGKFKITFRSIQPLGLLKALYVLLPGIPVQSNAVLKQSATLDLICEEYVSPTKASHPHSCVNLPKVQHGPIHNSNPGSLG